MIALALALSVAAAAPVEQYRETVNLYRSAPTAAVNTIRAMSDGEIAAALDAVARADTTIDRWKEEELELAALLHAQAAAECFRGQDLCGQPQVSYGIRAARLVADRGDAWFALRWFEGTARVLAAVDAAAVSQMVMKEIHTRPAVEFAARVEDALENEREGSEYAPHVNSAQAGLDAPIFMPNSFIQASDRFQAALKRDPRLLFAAVHAGRLAMLRGEDRPARAALERATFAVERPTRYLAHILLGSMDERLGHPSAASLHYVAAIALYPRALSARLALATLRVRGGEPADGALLDETIDDAEHAFDPWWTYMPIAPDRDPFFILSVLRAELLG